MFSKEILNRIFTAILTVVVLITFCIPSLAVENTSVSDTYEQTSASAAFVIDHTTGEILYSYNADVPLPPASTTKMLTTLLVLEAVFRGEVSLDDEVLVTKEVIESVPDDASRMRIPVVDGEYLTLRDLLYANMLTSDCMASNVLGAYIAGSLADFVVLMNTRAKELGCENTNFTNPSGYPDENMYTTAYSLYLIASECMKHELFREIVSSKSHTIPATNLNDERTLTNTNRLLRVPDSDYKNPYYYEYATGIKTGYSSSSGYCLVSAAEKDGHEIFVVILGGSYVISEDGTYSLTQYEETLRAYTYFYDFMNKREFLQGEFKIRTEYVFSNSDDAAITRSIVLDQNAEIAESFKQKQVRYEETIKKFFIIGAFALILVTVVLIIAITKHNKKKKKKKAVSR